MSLDKALARLLDQLPDTVVVLDALGRLKWGNRAAARLFSRTLEDTIDLPVLDLVHPDDIEFVLRSLASVQGKETGTLIEVRAKTPTGWRLMEVIGSPVDWEGEKVVLFSMRDLTERRRFEIAQNEEARLRSVVQNSAAITFLVSETGFVISVSAAITRVLGHDPELVAHRSLADLITEEDRSSLLMAMDRAANGASAAHPVVVDVGMLRYASSTTIPFELTIVNLVDDPTVNGYVVSAHDIRARTAAELELKETLSILSSTLEATVDGILVVDTSGRVTSFNRRFANMWRIPDSVLSKRDSAVLVAFVKDQLISPYGFQATVSEVYSTPEAEGNDILEFKDGRVFERSYRPQRVDGAITGIVWTFRDVTEQKRIEEELLESVQRFGQVFKQGPLGIAVVDLAFQIANVNDSMCRLLDRTREDLVGTTFESFTSRDDFMLQSELVKRVSSEPIASHQMELRFVTRTGGVVYASVTGSMIRNDLGRPIYGLFIVEDITRRKRLERELVAHAATAGKLLASFTAREVEILELLCDSVSAAKMAERLDVSVRTVESHLANAYRKLGVRTRDDAVAEFVRLNRAVAGLQRDLSGDSVVPSRPD
ncbi:MAG: PAS domain S-box protein [Acidimicrobiales bacterium]